MLPILQKPKADISLEVLDSAISTGSTFKVRVTLISMDNFSVRSGSVELICTEVYWQIVSTGKSTHQQKRSHKLFKEKKEFMGESVFSIGASEGKTLGFTIPDGLPPSVKGEKVNISWGLKASLNVAGKLDLNLKQEFEVKPSVIALPLSEDGSLSSGNNTSPSGLSLLISSQAVVGGQALKGKLTAMMEKQVNARGVRVELKVKEKAGTMSYEKLLDKVVLSSQTMLLGGGYREWHFTLKMPATPQVSIKTEKSSVVWELKGIVDKRLSRDINISLPIRVV